MYRKARLGGALALLVSLASLSVAYAQSVPLVEIPAAPGSYRLSASNSMTAAGLAGSSLQSDPPQLGIAPIYPADQQDGVSPALYVSNGLRNFRFNDFNNLFDYGGFYSWQMDDYAAVHGFSAIAEYNRNAAAAPWIPAGTGWDADFDKPEWTTFMGTLGLTAGRYDEVIDLGEPAILQALGNANYFSFVDPTATTEVMVDMEHQPLDPNTLRQQRWYPSGATDADRAAFEKKYYDGFAMTLYATVDYYRQRGFTNISIYGWSPANTGFNGLATYVADPSTDWYWQNVGIQVIGHVDRVTLRNYCDYSSILNTAYTLAQSDIAVSYVRTLPAAQQKPVRAYVSNQLIGGGDGWRWWAGQPLLAEEMRAIALLGAFTQYDGLVVFNFGPPANNNLPRPITTGVDVMIKDNVFTAGQEGGGPHTFARYDALHITNVDSSGNVQLQLIDKTGWGDNFAVGPTFPFYHSTITAMTSHLRTAYEPVAAVFEGLALAKGVESILRNGTAVVDFNSQQTFAQGSPILRHVVSGNLHLIATYDPQVAYGQPARTITVNNFNGVSGLTITFPADDQVRLFMVQSPGN